MRQLSQQCTASSAALNTWCRTCGHQVCIGCLCNAHISSEPVRLLHAVDMQHHLRTAVAHKLAIDINASWRRAGL